MAHAAEMAAACGQTGLPFFLGLAILSMESTWTIDGKLINGGANIYGHDPGGAMYVKPPAYVTVTEQNYAEFLQLLAGGAKSNGVGPMQITYRPYFQQAIADGLQLWKPADSMVFGCRILARNLARQLAKGALGRNAFWEVARAYNGGNDTTKGRDYADTAIGKAADWLRSVGQNDAPQFDFIGRVTA